ncbi:coatomer subunit zeta-2-like [Olea europaea subsp. europaea]|uniref:Coatomer subunit zeta n=1 Tax=Olea europaea subsp. europaea TaxID=158383 RepID=A0A8S0SV90_OLEEU|nr:coatomer subunit zeta-2-like [Olea europaea subsp. europaea]
MKVSSVRSTASTGQQLYRSRLRWLGSNLDQLLSSNCRLLKNAGKPSKLLLPTKEGNVDKREALENLDLILLCIDEIVDGGIILETDANSIATKVASNIVDAGAPLSEQTISQALATAREHLARSLLK